MRISVFGLGYVGCVTAACLADDGHIVIGVDINPDKVHLLQQGKSPISEPGLEDLVCTGVQSGRFHITCDGELAVQESDISLICVGTPSLHNGALNLTYVENVCKEIGAALSTKQDYHVVVVRSTILPGTVRDRLIPLLNQHSLRQAGKDFGVCFNPEFLREGTAIQDYYHPGYIIIGEMDTYSGDLVQQMYERIEAPVTRTGLETAEMVKYASNAFHALKIVFANEIGKICKVHGVDGQDVMAVIAVAHNPDIFPKLPQRVQLLVAGHTHGGQVRFPFIGAVVQSSDFGEKYERGYVFENSHHLFVSTGIGTSIMPVRFGVTPEIVLLTLNSK